MKQHRHVAVKLTLFLLFCLQLVYTFEFSSSPPVLQGLVDDCCCGVETVDEHLHSSLRNELSELSKKVYFKYFKVDFLRPCPFWAENYLCELSHDRTNGGCGICECDENEIPEPWKKEEGKVDQTISSAFHDWDDEDENIWTHPGDKLSYINLLLNPERYTGYGGFNASRIWWAIYQENCFSGNNGSMCFEERVFYRLISGFHASTTAHICEFYQGNDGHWQPNVEWFYSRLGNFPDRLKNIYFTFLFLLRATSKISPLLLENNYNTGNSEDDLASKELVKAVLNSKLLSTCSPLFNESSMFQGEKAYLRKEFKTKFLNISEIMDCVSCETCRVHAKLQILGMGTALKILLSPSTSQLDLQRNEIIALMNTLHKFSESIEIISLMRMRRESESQWKIASLLLVIMFIASTVAIVLIRNVTLERKKAAHAAHAAHNAAKQKKVKAHQH